AGAGPGGLAANRDRGPQGPTTGALLGRGVEPVGQGESQGRGGDALAAQAIEPGEGPRSPRRTNAAAWLRDHRAAPGEDAWLRAEPRRRQGTSGRPGGDGGLARRAQGRDGDLASPAHLGQERGSFAQEEPRRPAGDRRGVLRMGPRTP